MKRNTQYLNPDIPAVSSSTLPILRHKQTILNMIKSNQVSIVQAETGSGKSTQIPQYLLEAFPKSKIIVSQPRRMAAIAVARRVASELNTELGNTVGFHIKGECKTTNSTQITYMTAGVLIQIISHISKDRELPWDYVIMDEVHERSIEMDFLLVLFKYFLAKGKIFKLILMSATMQNILAGYFSKSSIDALSKKHFLLNDEEPEEEINWEVDEDEGKFITMKKNEFYRSSLAKVKAFLSMPDAIKIFSADNRKYRININYLEDILYFINDPSVLGYLNRHEKEGTRISLDSVENVFQQNSVEEIDPLLFNIAARIILSHILHNPESKSNHTFLVFLPGIQEISQMFDILQSFFSENFEEIDIIMLHSSIPEKEHIKVLRPPKIGTQRVILSTNIAESSITLPDVTFVIDFCCSREVYFNSTTMTENLLLVWAAKATMQQRAGRAGRVSEGTVYRLLTSDFYKSLEDYPTPEMQRSCLDKIILKLKLMDISEPKAILAETIEPPSYQEICRTEEYLKSMGALNSKGKISRIGKIYADMPYDIRVTRLCIFSIMFHCVEEATICAAILSLDKMPISNFSNMRPAESLKHPLTYRQRLKFSQDSDSDLIMYMNAFKLWYNKFGKIIQEQMFKHGHRHLRSVRPCESEKIFCEVNFLEVNSLREALCNYLDIKQKLLELRLDSMYYKPNNDINLLKLCIAAAYCDRFLISSYEISDEKSRSKYNDFLNRNNSGILITKLQPSITENDLLRLLEINLEAPSSIQINNTYTVIEYPPNVHKKTLQMALWLGNYGRRYQNLAWIIMKETISSSNTVWIKPSHQFSNKVPNEYRREGNTYNVNSGGRFSKIIEVHYIKRPEHPGRLHFRDIITKELVKIEEESVNHVILSNDPNEANFHTIVCTEYSERNSNLLGRNTTLLPLYHFLPYALLLIFNPNISYIADPESTRYSGFKINSDSVIEFSLLFTHNDALAINSLRERVGSFMNNSDYFEEYGFSTGIAESIFEFVKLERVPIKSNYPEWKKMIPLDFLSPSEQFEHWESDGYLPPIKLLSLQSPLEFTSDDIQHIQELKKDYVDYLHKTAEIVECTDSELICAICHQSICPLNKVKQVSYDPPLFQIKPQYGSLTNKSVVEHNEMSLFADKNYIINQWEVCNKNHIIGWSDDDGTYINHLSPVKILLPMMIYLDFNEKSWENDFFEVRLQNEECKRELEEMEYERCCNICEESFETDEMFSRHVRMNEKHFTREQQFLEIYMN